TLDQRLQPRTLRAARRGQRRQRRRAQRVERRRELRPQRGQPLRQPFLKAGDLLAQRVQQRERRERRPARDERLEHPLVRAAQRLDRREHALHLVERRRERGRSRPPAERAGERIQLGGRRQRVQQRGELAHRFPHGGQHAARVLLEARGQRAALRGEGEHLARELVRRLDPLLLRLRRNERELVHRPGIAGRQVVVARQVDLRRVPPAAVVDGPDLYARAGLRARGLERLQRAVQPRVQRLDVLPQ